MELQRVAVGAVFLLILLSSGELLSLFNILNHVFVSEGRNDGSLSVVINYEQYDECSEMQMYLSPPALSTSFFK